MYLNLYSSYSIVFQVNNLKKLVKGVHDYYTEVCMLRRLIYRSCVHTNLRRHVQSKADWWPQCIPSIDNLGQPSIDNLLLDLHSIAPQLTLDQYVIHISADSRLSTEYEPTVD